MNRCFERLPIAKIARLGFFNICILLGLKFLQPNPEMRLAVASVLRTLAQWVEP